MTIPGADEGFGLTGDFDMTGDLTIDGAGASSTIIDGNGLDRVLHISDLLGPSATVIEGVTITGGRASAAEDLGGGGIFTAGGTVVGGNKAGTSDGAGGGIMILSGDLEIINSTISGNQAPGGGGGLANSGGTASVISSTFSATRRRRATAARYPTMVSRSPLPTLSSWETAPIPGPSSPTAATSKLQGTPAADPDVPEHRLSEVAVGPWRQALREGQEIRRRSSASWRQGTTVGATISAPVAQRDAQDDRSSSCSKISTRRGVMPAGDRSRGWTAIVRIG